MSICNATSVPPLPLSAYSLSVRVGGGGTYRNCEEGVFLGVAELGYLNPFAEEGGLQPGFLVNCFVLCLLFMPTALSTLFYLPHILSLLPLSAMSAMMLSPSLSPGFIQSGPGPQEIIPSPFSTSSSSSISSSISTSTSAYEFGVEMGIIPSTAMLPAPPPIQAPVQYPSVPFVPARARMAEFERLREELRRTEMVREKQVEMLHALANEASHELDVPQV